jgi:hypothetical protein
MTSTELRTHLLTLSAERAAASLAGEQAGSADDLVAEIEAARHAFVGVAVTEIASFRAQLSGPQIG